MQNLPETGRLNWFKISIVAIVILVVAAVLLILILFFMPSCQIQDSGNQNNLVGGEKDEHGCLIPAGYSWCGAKQKCLRIWEEDCDNKKIDPGSGGCAQVITPARNIATGEIKNFATPCDVPNGWEIVK